MYIYVKTFVIILIVASMANSFSASKETKAVTRNSSCYTFHGSEALSWTKSRKECIKTGGDLVSMETKEEWEFIRDQIQNISTVNEARNEWHIGLEKDSNVWKWLSKTPLKTTCEKKSRNREECWPWQRGEPSKPTSNGAEDVALMAKNYPNKTKGLFNNINKSGQERGFICEFVTGKCKRTVNTNYFEPTTIASAPNTRSKSSSHPETQTSNLRSEIRPTSEHEERNKNTMQMNHWTQASMHPTKNKEPEQPGADNGGSSNSTIIIVLAAVISVLIIATAILVIIIMCRRRSQSKQIQELYNEG